MTLRLRGSEDKEAQEDSISREVWQHGNSHQAQERVIQSPSKTYGRQAPEDETGQPLTEETRRCSSH